MSRITKTEIAAMIITAVLLALAFGYYLGRNSGDSTVTVDGDQPEAVVTLPPEAPEELPTENKPEISLTDESNFEGPDSVLPNEEDPENESGLLDLNEATLDELENLPDIGPVLAQRILDYREANGGFISVDELKNVDGIGDKIFEAVENLVEVGN